MATNGLVRLAMVSMIAAVASLTTGCVTEMEAGSISINPDSGKSELSLVGNDGTKLSLPDQAAVSLTYSNTLGSDPELIIQSGQAVAAITIPEPESRDDLSATAEQMHQDFDLSGKRTTKLVATRYEEGTTSCTHAGFCYSMGKYGYHLTCSGSQSAILEVRTYEDTFTAVFSKPGRGEVIATFRGQPKAYTRSHVTRTTSSCH